MEMNIEEWGTIYNSKHIRIKASPDKTKIFIEIKQQAGLDDHSTMVKNIANALAKAGIKSYFVSRVYGYILLKPLFAYESKEIAPHFNGWKNDCFPPAFVFPFKISFIASSTLSAFIMV